MVASFIYRVDSDFALRLAKVLKAMTPVSRLTDSDIPQDPLR